MKRTCGLLLTLVLSLSAFTTGGALTITRDNSDGFVLTDTGTIDIIDAKTLLYTHEKTGARVMHIANEDKERAFVITFETPALDNKGIPHVFEHVTLGGSESYPSPALFFSVIYQTYNTNVNATTYNSMTNYFYSTMSEDQLLSIADFYLDSAFHPLLYRDEMAFLREAWRYELADADSPLDVNGIVYNEMKGAYDLHRAAGYNMLGALYPGSEAANDSGGVPDSILTMTYEDLINFHQSYYHPSNALFFLYGDLDIEPFLSLIGSYCDQYEKRDIRVEKNIVALSEPVAAVYEFPMEISSEVNANSVISYAINLGKLSPEKFGAFDILSEALANDASLVKSKLREVLPGANISVYLAPSTAGDYIAVNAQGVDEGDMEIFKSTVDQAFTEIAADGFDRELLEATISATEFYVLSMPERSGLGISVINSMAYLASTGSGMNYWNDYLTALETVKTEYKNSFFEALIDEYIIDNPHHVLVCTVPAPGLREKLDAELRAKLDGMKAGMTPEDIADIIERNQAFAAMAEAEAPKELLNRLTAVTVETLPTELKTYDITEQPFSGARIYTAQAPVAGINMTSVDLNSAEVPPEDLHYLNLYSYLLGKMPTENYDLTTLQTKVARYLNNANATAGSRVFYDFSFKPMLNVQWYSLNDDYAEAIELVSEILRGTDLTDTETISGHISRLKTATKNAINDSPHSAMYTRALASRFDCFAYDDFLQGIAYYQFLGEAAEQIESDPDAFIAKMESVRAMLCHKDGAVIMFAGNAEGIELFAENIGVLFAHMNDLPAAAADLTSIPKPLNAEAVVIESSVQFNTVFASHDEMGLEYNGKLLAIGELLADAYLIPAVRYSIGAYGVFPVLSRYGMAFISYRDPSVTDTFSAYKGMAGFAADSGLAQEDIDRYIISAFAYNTLPEGELSGAITAMQNKYLGFPDDYKLNRLNEIKTVTGGDIEALSKYLAYAAADGYRSTAGSQSAIIENADLYEQILYPFGVSSEEEAME